MRTSSHPCGHCTPGLEDISGIVDCSVSLVDINPLHIDELDPSTLSTFFGALGVGAHAVIITPLLLNMLIDFCRSFMYPSSVLPIAPNRVSCFASVVQQIHCTPRVNCKPCRLLDQGLLPVVVILHDFESAHVGLDLHDPVVLQHSLHS